MKITLKHRYADDDAYFDSIYYGEGATLNQPNGPIMWKEDGDDRWRFSLTGTSNVAFVRDPKGGWSIDGPRDDDNTVYPCRAVAVAAWRMSQ